MPGTEIRQRRRPTLARRGEQSSDHDTELMRAALQQAQAQVYRRWAGADAGLPDQLRLPDGVQVLVNGQPLQGAAAVGAVLGSGEAKGVVGDLSARIVAEMQQETLREMRVLLRLRNPADARLMQELAQWPGLQSAYRDVLALDTFKLVAELQGYLTQDLVSFVSGASTRTVRAWSQGQPMTRFGNVTTLRAMLTATRLLLLAEQAKVVLRWWGNANPGLDGRSPAELLKQNSRLTWIIRLAAAYAQNGE